MGNAIVRGDNIIIPIAKRMFEVTKSITKNGKYIKTNPRGIVNAFPFIIC